jgi:hypothetical protein
VLVLRSTIDIAAVNLSLGGGGYTDQATCDQRNAATKRAIDQLRDAGIATVIAAGNNGYTNALSAPACISSAISVGSTRDGGSGATPADAVSPFSNVASFLDLLAPGQVITSSILNNQFGLKSGTSMAAPHVAGAWAVLKSGQPSATVSQVLDALRLTGLPVSDAKAPSITTMRIDVGRALDALAPACTYSLFPVSRSIGSGAAQETLTVMTQAGCGWQAASDASFLALVGDTARVGDGTITYAVSANPATSSRSGRIIVGGQTFTLTQAAAPVIQPPPPPPPSPDPPPVMPPARGDFNGDRRPDLLWHHRGTGQVAVWFMNGAARTNVVYLSPASETDTSWEPAGVADFNGDGHNDVLWQNAVTGELVVWHLNGVTRTSRVPLSHRLGDPRWRVRGVADMNGDARPDLVLQHPVDGLVGAWLLNGVTLVEGRLLDPGALSPDWRIAGAGDVNRDGKPDLLFQHREGWLAVWYMDRLNMLDAVYLNPAGISDPLWVLAGVSDVNSDGSADLLLHHAGQGLAGVWLMNGVHLVDGRLFDPSTVPDTSWRIIGPR